MKTKRTILLIGLACATALSASLFTGCETVEKAHDAYNEFEESNPLLASAIEGTARALLYSRLGDITSDPLKRQLLTSVIDAAFVVSDTPDSVASGLQVGLAKVYPGDTATQAKAIDVFVDVLTQPADTNVPASGIGSSYNRALADALRPAVVTDYSFDPVYSVTLAREI